MRKILITAAAGAALAITPALASKPAEKPQHPSQSHKGKAHTKAKGRCKVHTVGYNAKGTLVSQTLTQTAGADTTTDTSDDRWSGDVVVNVTWANHKSPKGEQTFSFTNGKVAWYDAANDGTADPAVAGDTVRIHGKISKQAKKCNGTNSPAVVTIKPRSAAFTQATTAPTS
jgi:hypothetical protein